MPNSPSVERTRRTRTLPRTCLLLTSSSVRCSRPRLNTSFSLKASGFVPTLSLPVSFEFLGNLLTYKIRQFSDVVFGILPDRVEDLLLLGFTGCYVLRKALRCSQASHQKQQDDWQSLSKLGPSHSKLFAVVSRTALPTISAIRFDSDRQ